MEWNIWRDAYFGHVGQGDYSLAHCIGSAEGETFEEACAAFFKDKDPKQWGEYQADSNSVYGCCLFENETDARAFEKRIYPNGVPS